MFLKDVEGGGSSVGRFYCLSGSCFLGPSGLVFDHGKYQAVGVRFMYPLPWLIAASWFPLWLCWEDVSFTSCFSNGALILVHFQGTPAILPSASFQASPSMLALVISIRWYQMSSTTGSSSSGRDCKTAVCTLSSQTERRGRHTSVGADVWHLPFSPTQGTMKVEDDHTLSFLVTGQTLGLLSRNDYSRKSVTWSKLTGLE